MATKCTNVKEMVSQVKETSEIREKEQKNFWKKRKSVATFLGYSEENQRKVEDKIVGDKRGFGNEEDVDRALKEIHGKDERAFLASKLSALMNGNEQLTEWAEEIILTHLPSNEEQMRFTNGKLHLNQVKLSTLKVISREFLIISEAGDGSNLAKGLFGKTVVPLLTPKQLSKLESSGALYTITKALKRYFPAISRRINDFQHNPITYKSDRNYGMADIYNKVESLSYYLKGVEDSQDKMIDLFTRLMAGWVYFEKKTGEFMIYEDWLSTGKKYKTTGKNIYRFMNPVPLKDYKPPHGKEGDFFLDLPIKARRELFKLMNQARSIDDEVFEYIDTHFNSSISNIVQSLSEYVGINKLTIHKLLMATNYEEVKVWNVLNKEKQDKFKKLHDVFGDFASMRITMFGSTNAEYKPEHWPIQYPTMIFSFLWEHMIRKLERKAKLLEVEVKTSTGKDRIDAKTELTNTKNAITRALGIRERKDGYQIDQIKDIVIPLAKDVKHLEHISNSIDIRNMITDRSVYYEYLKHVMSAIERNNLVAKFIEAYSKAQSDFVRDEVISQFKIPFNKPESESSYMGLNISSQGFTDQMAKLGFIVDPRRVQDTMRITSQWLTSRYLSGMYTTAQNWLAIHQNIINFGFGHLRESISEYKKYKKEWNRLIAASGITEFGDFFSKAWINRMGQMEFESETQKKIIVAMLNFAQAYNPKKNQKYEDSKAYEELQNTIAGILGQAKIWVDKLYFDPLNEGIKDYVKRLKKRETKRKQERRMQFTKKIAAYAITMDWASNKAITGKWKYTYKPFQKWREGYSYFRKYMLNDFTMSNTEQFIRSVSFIIGIKRAQKIGYLPPGRPWEFTGNNLNLAIRIGTIYQDNVNFGLSTQDVGKWNRGDFGKLQGKFKFWSQQKAGLEMRIIRDGITSIKDINDIYGTKGDLFNIKDILKAWKTSWTPGISKENPEAGKLGRLSLFIGISTALYDIMFAPLGHAPRLIRTMYYSLGGGFGGKAIRSVSSDLLSLAMMPLTMLARFGLSALLDSNDDEPDEFIDALIYYMRRTFIGFLPSWSIERVMDLANAFINEDRASEVVSKTVSPFLPASEELEKAGKSLVKYFD